MRRRLRVALTGWLVLALLVAVPGVGAAVEQRVFDGFDRTWARTNAPEARGDRTFMWGPVALLPVDLTLQEQLIGLPGGQRAVRYWDKARIEVNDPGATADQWYVTNGLLVSEMVLGRIQIGVDPVQYAMLQRLLRDAQRERVLRLGGARLPDRGGAVADMVRAEWQG